MLNNSFTCSNGHTFEANAKLRARCPECGLLARRFGKAEPKQEPVVTKPKEVVHSVKPKVHKATLLRAGRPRLPKPVIEKEPIVPKRKVVARKSPSKAVVKPATKLTPGRASAGLVKVHKVKRIATPTVNRRPKRTAIARHITTNRKESFLDRVMTRFGPG